MAINQKFLKELGTRVKCVTHGARKNPRKYRSTAIMSSALNHALIAYDPDMLREGAVMVEVLDFTHRNLENANFEGRALQRAKLAGSNLRSARLSRADLLEADLFGADLARSDLQRANLTKAILRGVNLKGANLNSAI